MCLLVSRFSMTQVAFRCAIWLVRVLLTSERREEAPRLFTHINLHFIVTGRDLKDAAVARAVDLSAEKYCSVALMLEKAVNITHSYEVVAA